MRVSEALRRIIRESGMTQYEIAKRSGVQQSQLSRLMAGFDVSTSTLDKLQPVLGLRLVADATKRARSAGTKPARGARKGSEG